MYFNKEGVAYFEYEKEIQESDEEEISGEGSPVSRKEQKKNRVNKI